MRKTRFAIGLAALAAVWALTGAVLAGPAPAARAHAVGQLHCPAPARATGHESLVQVSRSARVPVAVLLWFAFRCPGFRGGGWTQKMARYLNAGDLRAPLARGTWYWVPRLN